MGVSHKFFEKFSCLARLERGILLVMLMGPIELLRALATVGILAFALLYACFLGAMHGRRGFLDESNSRVERAGWAALAVASVAIGYPLDIAFNWTYGLALGVTRDVTLSGKLETIRETVPGGWRRDVADFLCQRMLNPHDNDHC